MSAVMAKNETKTLYKGVVIVRNHKEAKTRTNSLFQTTVNNIRGKVRPGEEIEIEFASNELMLVRQREYCSVFNSAGEIVGRCESIVVLDNGWMVACKYGRYDLYYKDGTMYKGLMFLKKSNAIKFAKTLWKKDGENSPSFFHTTSHI